MKSIAVVTSTIGRPLLEETIQSVIAQTRQARHYVFVHGVEFWDKAKVILDKYPDVTALYLPNNNGGNGYGMAPVFAMAGWVVSEDVVCYLDDDNWYNSNHLETTVGLLEKHDLNWVFALRNIVDADGSFIMEDNCESLGYFPNAAGQHLVDNSCFVVKVEHARMLGVAWYTPQVSDRSFLNALLTHKLNAGTTGLHSVNYRISKDGSGGLSLKNMRICNDDAIKSNKGTLPWKQESILTYKGNNES